MRKEHWERFAENVGIIQRLVLTRVAEVARRVQAARLSLFKGAFACYRCDALYRLMELVDAQVERVLTGGV